MELNLAQPLSSISVIFIVRDSPLDLGVTERLLGVLGAAFADIETVIVANGVSTATSTRADLLRPQPRRSIS